MTQQAEPYTPSLGLVITILVMTSSVSIMSTDMYAPSLPSLADEFNTTPSLVKLTISLNLLAYGFAQLIHGPLSDRFGRRPVLLASLTGVVIGCLFCVVAQSINQLIAARIFLGLVAAAEAVIGLAVIKDLFNEKQQIKAFALFGMVIAMVPAIAPIIGGYMHVAFGWQSNFYAIAIMAILSCIVVYQLLPETSTPDVQALEPKRVFSAYASLLRNRDFLLHSLILGIALGLVYVFVTAAPFVLITLFEVPVHLFGYHQAVIVVSFFVGCLIASKLADSWPAARLLNAGICFVLAGSACLVVLIASDTLSAVSLVAAYSVMTFGMGPVFAVAPSHALRTIKTNAGAASALLSGLEQITAALSGVAVSLFHDGTAKPMATATVLLSVALILLCWLIKKQSDAAGNNKVI